jgi:NADPH-dependent curcumin reductase CurA
MSKYVNRRVILSRRPSGEIRDGDLTLASNEVPPINDGEMLIQVLWLSLDPYMRPLMNDSKSYANPMSIGGVIYGESVGRVIESISDNYEVGDIVTCSTGWQEYYAADEGQENMAECEATLLDNTRRGWTRLGAFDPVWAGFADSNSAGMRRLENWES